MWAGEHKGGTYVGSVRAEITHTPPGSKDPKNLTGTAAQRKSKIPPYRLISPKSFISLSSLIVNKLSVPVPTRTLRCPTLLRFLGWKDPIHE